MAVTVGMNGSRQTVQDVFDVTDMERREVEQLIKRMEEALEKSGEQKRHVVLAALAELSARHLSSPVEKENSAVENQAVS